MSYILITIVGFTTLIGLTGCSMTQNNEHNENTTRTDYTVNGGNDQLNVAYNNQAIQSINFLLI